jgi:ABC-2 type transport system ATP-binding protein
MSAIVIDSACKSFRQPLWRAWRKPGSGSVALANISLQVPAATVQVLLGPNGSGKTTLLKLISTMLLPDSGTVFVEAFDTRVHEKEIRKRLGFAVANERSFFPRLTARENLEFFAALDEVPRRERVFRVLELLNTVGLREHADKLVMNFSAGMYQRLAIARALLKNPCVVLLDEPSRSLDPGSAAQLWELVREVSAEGKTVLIASHNFQEAAAVADNVAVLSQGRLCGERRISSSTCAETLREFYFECIGDRAGDSILFESDNIDAELAG